MADQDNRERDKETEQEAPSEKGSTGRILPWLITALAIVVCAGAGFVVGRVFGTRGQTQTVSAAEQADPAQASAQGQSAADTVPGPGWYYDLDPVVANLNEPGVTRYVRVALTLEINKSMAQNDGVTFLQAKTPLLKNWLTLYLSNRTLEEIRGEANLRRMQTQIADAFNQGLFPDAKPRVQHVLFKEFSIQ